ncbi:hypothetical protein MICRO8M_60208 [Microbacterium sp. 8M]|nr:hypothetical protein MICRO8M_60208 [Microbacterium sp. 8M]
MIRVASGDFGGETAQCVVDVGHAQAQPASGLALSAAYETWHVGELHENAERERLGHRRGDHVTGAGELLVHASTSLP